MDLSFIQMFGLLAVFGGALGLVGVTVSPKQKIRCKRGTAIALFVGQILLGVILMFQ